MTGELPSETNSPADHQLTLFELPEAHCGPGTVLIALVGYVFAEAAKEAKTPEIRDDLVSIAQKALDILRDDFGIDPSQNLSPS